MRTIALTFLVIAAPNLACSGESRTTVAQDAAPSDAGDADGSTVGADLEIEGCARFVLEFAPTCQACPSEPLTCPCLTDLDLAPFARCNFGRCLRSIDCAEVCKHAEDLPDFLKDAEKAHQCVSQRLCHLDSDCGDRGKCVGETSVNAGECTTGELDTFCRDQADCWSGICAVTPNRSSCQDGRPGSPCGADEDCPMGRCLSFGGDEGVCTTGAAGDPCHAAADCVPGTSCVFNPAGASAALGTCLAGNVGDSCDDDQQCKSRACVSMTCASGEVRAYCLKDQHCKSGICVLQPGVTAVGTCGSGDNGFYCFADDDCRSGFCALNQYATDLGVCTNGADGDPCRQADDCKGSACSVARAAEPDVCQGEVGTMCGSSGTCGDDHLCYYGRCGH